MNRPFKALGIGWIFAAIVLVLAVLGLLDVVKMTATLVQVEVILLALALLL
jgi:hypothetical protein